jgi:U3 small nucleolar RNA-associated protein 5
MANHHALQFIHSRYTLPVDAPPSTQFTAGYLPPPVNVAAPTTSPPLIPAMSTKRKLSAKLGQPTLKPTAKVLGRSAVDESRTVVSGTGPTTKTGRNGVSEVVEISSGPSSAGEEEDDEEEDEEEEDDDDDDEEEEEEEEQPSEESEEADLHDEPEVDSPADGADVSMHDVPDELAEPSFGDLVRANAAEPIDVAAFDQPASGTRTSTQAVPIQAPSGASLGTVLTQALRTNDVVLLESCLHTTDLDTIRATIQRLDSPLAGALLQKLAERLHRRPGRAGSLMVWVQWTLVTHGGYLATQRDLIKKLAELNRVIDERAKGLQSLLSLKGKLDMLEAQIELRRSMQNQRRQLDEEDDDEDVIYVEGQESEEEAAAKQRRLAPNGDVEDISDGESEVSEDMPLTNGRIINSDEEESESSEDDDDDLIDAEAEETDEDNADENDVDHDDQDEEAEEEESDDGGAPPPKVQRTGGVSARRR